MVDFIDASLGAGLIISSIADGPGQRLEVPTGSRSARHIAEVAAMLADEPGEHGEALVSRGAPAPSMPARRTPEADAEEHTEKTGSGFFVDASGTIMTNAHVIEGCTRFSAAGRPSELVAQSSIFDLALLRPRDGRGAESWLSFADAPAGLNADITVAGYPLHGLLGGLNITRGTVSGLKGLGGDEVNLQISAPVQPGNSGGPMVNDRGEVVGVVVAKLDAMVVADAIGDVPQNINFAIRGEVAKMALSANDVDVDVTSGGAPLSPEEIATQLQGATVLIECQ